MPQFNRRLSGSSNKVGNPERSVALRDMPYNSAHTQATLRHWHVLQIELTNPGEILTGHGIGGYIARRFES
jgi:hypothetical protein